MNSQPIRNYTRVALAIVIAALVIGSVVYLIVLPNNRTIVTTTLFSFPSGASIVTEEIIIEPEVINSICILQSTLTTSTAYVVAANSSKGSETDGVQMNTVSTTTKTFSALSTTTVYDNVTNIIQNVTSCTLINPHYNVTQSSTCAPCE
jgi:hypothetical protein